VLARAVPGVSLARTAACRSSMSHLIEPLLLTDHTGRDWLLDPKLCAWRGHIQLSTPPALAPTRSLPPKRSSRERTPVGFPGGRPAIASTTLPQPINALGAAIGTGQNAREAQMRWQSR
jgi:hypothetical protein